MPSVEHINAGDGQTPVKVLVIGGCYGGLATALNLLDLCHGRPARFSGAQSPALELRPILPVDIKIVDERDGYYHLIGSPLAFASKTYAAKAWTRYDDIPALRTPSISWIQGSAIRVDCERKLATIVDSNTNKAFEESYDYLLASTGLRRAWPTVPQALRRKDYLSEVNGHIDAVYNSRQGVVVIGGGAVGIEMAAELKLCQPNQKVTLIHSRDKLLSSEPLPDDFKDRSLLALQEAGVDVILGQRVISTIAAEENDSSPIYNLTLRDGKEIRTGYVIEAISRSIPSTSYLPEVALDSEGYVKIGPTMNFTVDVPNSRNHFAVGDIAAWSGIKRCGAAMAMGNVAAANIHQQLLQQQLGKTPKFINFPEVPPMIALAVGKQAVLYGQEDGTSCGEDLMEMMFGVDLGYSTCWNYLKLGEDIYSTTNEVEPVGVAN